MKILVSPLPGLKLLSESATDYITLTLVVPTAVMCLALLSS